MSLQATIDKIEENAEVVVPDTNAISREEWLGLRTLGIGGSDAPAALGLSPWKSPYALWAEKRGSGYEVEQSEVMFWGQRLEEPIGMAFGEVENLEVAPYKAMLRSKEWPWMVVNLDLIAEDLAPVEVKNVGQWSGRHWEDDAIPEHYAIQGLHELAVTGLERVHFPVLVAGQELQVRTLERDEAMIQDLVELERRFWERVQSGAPPAVDGHPETGAILASLYADTNPGAVVQLPPEVLTWGLERKALIAQRDDLDERIRAYENGIKAALGEAEVGKVGEKVVATWKPQTRKGVDTTRLQVEHPELAEQYRTQTTFRRLLIK